MLAAARLLEGRLDPEGLGGVAYIIPSPTDAMRALAEKPALRCGARPKCFEVLRADARHVLLQASAAAVASGTATLEACLARCPTALVYQINAPTAWVMRRLVTVKFAGLANIIAGREVMPELLQSDFTAPRLAGHLYDYITNPATRDNAQAAYGEVAQKLGPGHAAECAAGQIMETLGI
jgi:lipid-A-disaccharide synthase